MEKLIDAIMTLIVVLAVSTGGHYALRQSLLWVRKAALEKSAQGLPPLTPFARRLSGR